MSFEPVVATDHNVSFQPVVTMEHNVDEPEHDDEETLSSDNDRSYICEDVLSLNSELSHGCEHEDQSLSHGNEKIDISGCSELDEIIVQPETASPRDQNDDDSVTSSTEDLANIEEDNTEQAHSSLNKSKSSLEPSVHELSEGSSESESDHDETNVNSVKTIEDSCETSHIATDNAEAVTIKIQSVEDSDSNVKDTDETIEQPQKPLEKSNVSVVHIQSDMPQEPPKKSALSDAEMAEFVGALDMCLDSPRDTTKQDSKPLMSSSSEQNIGSHELHYSEEPIRDDNLAVGDSDDDSLPGSRSNNLSGQIDFMFL